jgi:O-antigen/teichoic acid export membrane protein
MIIVLILLYGGCFIGLWYLLKFILKEILKEKYQPSYVIIAFLILLPVVIIALGFLAITLTSLTEASTNM